MVGRGGGILFFCLGGWQVVGRCRGWMKKTSALHTLTDGMAWEMDSFWPFGDFLWKYRKVSLPRKGIWSIAGILLNSNWTFQVEKNHTCHNRRSLSTVDTLERERERELCKGESILGDGMKHFFRPKEAVLECKVSLSGNWGPGCLGYGMKSYPAK